MPITLYIVVGLVLFSTVAFGAAKILRPAPINITRLIEAIRMVENTPRHRIGGAGERSEWQITKGVWSGYSNKPFEWASMNNRVAVAETRRVVATHVEWILAQLPYLSCPRDAYHAALVWAAGPGAVREWKISAAKEDYARRVMNLYLDLEEQADEDALIASPKFQPNEISKPRK